MATKSAKDWTYKYTATTSDISAPHSLTDSDNKNRIKSVHKGQHHKFYTATLYRYSTQD